MGRFDVRNYLVGCGQITWMTDWQNPPPREVAMKDIAAAGYDGAPVHAMPGETAADVLRFYAEFGLKPGPGYLGANWWDRRDRETGGAGQGNGGAARRRGLRYHVRRR